MWVRLRVGLTVRSLVGLRVLKKECHWVVLTVTRKVATLDALSAVSMVCAMGATMGAQKVGLRVNGTVFYWGKKWGTKRADQKDTVSVEHLVYLWVVELVAMTANSKALTKTGNLVVAMVGRSEGKMVYLLAA